MLIGPLKESVSRNDAPHVSRRNIKLYTSETNSIKGRLRRQINLISDYMLGLFRPNPPLRVSKSPRTHLVHAPYVYLVVHSYLLSWSRVFVICRDFGRNKPIWAYKNICTPCSDFTNHAFYNRSGCPRVRLQKWFTFWEASLYDCQQATLWAH